MIKAENAKDNAFTGILAYGVALALAALVCLGFSNLFGNFYTNVTADPNLSEVPGIEGPRNWGILLSMPFVFVIGWQTVVAIKYKFALAAGPKVLRAVAENVSVRIVVFLSLLYGLSYLQTLEPLKGIIGKNSDLASSYIDATATFIAFVVMSKLFHQRSISSWGLALKGMPFDTVFGFFCGGIMMSLIAGGLFVSNVYHVVSVNWSAQVLPALVFFSMAAFIEELIFRGYVFQAVEAKRGTTFALAVTALLFGFAHMMNFIQGAPIWVRLYGCFCLVFEAGILLNAAFILRRTLWFATGMHWAWNFFEGPIFGMDVSGTDGGPSIVTGRLTGDVFANGGQFGPEASLSGVLIGTAFGALFIWLCMKRGQWLSREQAVQVEAQRVAALVLSEPEMTTLPADDKSQPPPGVGYDI